MKKCENCGNEHNETYGSGRFCSKKCAKGFSTKAKRSLINEIVSKKLLKRDYVKRNCPICEKEFITWGKKNKICCSKSCATTKRNNLPENKIKSSNIAKKYFNGNRNSYAHGWYNSPIAGKVFLESSYELKVAEELDKNNIQWIRPKYFYWINEKNETKRYFPDFYLIDYNVYLDPKNNFLINQDKDKIKRVIEQNNIKILVLDKNTLTWNNIKNCIMLK